MGSNKSEFAKRCSTSWAPKSKSYFLLLVLVTHYKKTNLLMDNSGIEKRLDALEMMLQKLSRSS